MSKVSTAKNVITVELKGGKVFWDDVNSGVIKEAAKLHGGYKYSYIKGDSFFTLQERTADEIAKVEERRRQAKVKQLWVDYGQAMAAKDTESAADILLELGDIGGVNSEVA